MNIQNENFRILIVDDTIKNIQVLGTILRGESYLTNVAQDGLKALEIVSLVRPDLILLDIMMPELDGFETCKRLKDNPDTRDIPVVFLTAKTEIDDMVHGFELGAVDYITKPFNPTELLARVRTHLQVYHLQEELRHQLGENARLKREQEAFLRHELKNNLTPIQGYAELLLKTVELEEKPKKWMASIFSGTEKIVSLIDALRKLQDLESNTVKLTKTPVHVQDMIQKIIADLDIAFEHQVPINFEHPPLPTMIMADEIFLRGVFQNLIKNGLEHVCKLDETQRKVSVQILEDNQHVCVSVANLGSAIPQARLETFFD
ncbi:MAG: response regulator, partial [Candidatus Latescibacteria bacterium]|nr:response regulator [Candidatus Latescibacterota bacterium]